MQPSRKRLIPVDHEVPEDLLKLVVDGRLLTEDDIRKALLPYATWTMYDLIRHPKTARALRYFVSPIGFVDTNCYDPPIQDEHRDVLGISPGTFGMRRAVSHWQFTRRGIWCVGEVDQDLRIYIIQSEQPGVRLDDARLLPIGVRVHSLQIQDTPT